MATMQKIFVSLILLTVLSSESFALTKCGESLAKLGLKTVADELTLMAYEYEISDHKQAESIVLRNNLDQKMTEFMILVGQAAGGSKKFKNEINRYVKSRLKEIRKKGPADLKAQEDLEAKLRAQEKFELLTAEYTQGVVTSWPYFRGLSKNDKFTESFDVGPHNTYFQLNTVNGTIDVKFSEPGVQMLFTVTYGLDAAHPLIYDLKSADPIRTDRIIVSPNGERIAAPVLNSQETRIQIFDAKTGDLLATLKDLPLSTSKGDQFPILQFSHDGQRLAVAGKVTGIWDVDTGEKTRDLKRTDFKPGETEFVGVPNAVEWTRDDHLVAVSNPQTIYTFNTSTGAQAQRIVPITQDPYALFKFTLTDDRLFLKNDRVMGLLNRTKLRGE